MKPFRAICTYIGMDALTLVKVGRFRRRRAEPSGATGAAAVQLCVTVGRRTATGRGFSIPIKDFGRWREIAGGPPSGERI